MLNFIRNKLSQYTWALAYGVYDEKINIEGAFGFSGNLHYVYNPYKKKWFADPFILSDSDDKLELLVEEFDSGIKKGRIARIVINKQTNKIVNCSIILELPTHLSFPAIYRFDEKIYVHPENSASGVSTIYEYDVKNDKLTKPVVLVERPLTDAVILSKGDGYYMYATEIPTSGGDILTEYKSDSFVGTYKEIRRIKFSDNTARMAGAFFEYKGKQIRPAQDCNHDYGRAVVFYDDNRRLGEIRPKGLKYEGIHTFNIYGKTFVIDLKKYDLAYFRSLLKRLLFVK